MKIRFLLYCAVAALMPATGFADVKPHTICSEGMVLQQKSYARIWGTADAGEKVKVTFRDSLATVETGKDGRWVVAVPTGEAGGPFEMTIAGKNTIAYKNILVGEVWVCSGQSNMEWKVAACDQPDKDDATKAPANSKLRIFHVSKSPQSTPQTEIAVPTPNSPNYAVWIEASPKTALDFSAVSYFFGRSLQEKLKVPVGLVHTSWGGTRIEAWMSQKALEAAGVKDANPKKVNPPNVASALYNGMIHPILKYNIKGAIWYQGESNAGNAYQYRTLHPGMIESWRADFKNAAMPFYFVQLAPYNAIPKKPGESTWAELREAQTMTLNLKNTGMAVITDLGDEFDIHPTPKRPVGERLALNALAKTYGQKIVYSGPMYKEVKFDGKKAVITFDSIGGGLVGKEMVPEKSRNPKAPPTMHAWRVKAGAPSTQTILGFTVCGKDKVFHEAKGDIVGNTVVVTSDAVAEPMAVRFGWANHPLCNLFNVEGLPASPFRTDTFPGITQPKQ
jgi:sialate O-acetylesterase